MYLREVICEQVPGREMFILNTPHQLGSLGPTLKCVIPVLDITYSWSLGEVVA